jgi:hypothetical protein
MLYNVLKTKSNTPLPATAETKKTEKKAKEEKVEVL